MHRRDFCLPLTAASTINFVMIKWPSNSQVAHPLRETKNSISKANHDVETEEQTIPVFHTTASQDPEKFNHQDHQ